jgi:hypothetical protein
MEYVYPAAGPPDDEDIVSQMEARLNVALTISQDWRQNEVRENFALFEGNQWLQETIERQTANMMPIVSINRTSPIIEAICGFEIQNRLDIQYLPRMLQPDQMGYSDIMNNAVKYIEENAKAHSQYSYAFKDMLICGVGATDTVINYDNNPDGEVVIERIFPAFLFWDMASRAKNIIDSDYVVRLKVMNTEVIEQEYGVEFFDDIYNAALDARILEFFNQVLAVKTLGVVYEYQWRQKEPFYRVNNPFIKMDPQAYTPEIMMLVEALKAEYAEKYNFVPDADPMFSVEKGGDLSGIKETFEALGIRIKPVKQHQFKYYRAIITGGKVVEKSENYSHTGFSIKFMTGQFSELTQSYYGLVRFCKDPQRLLNQAVSDYQGFLQTIPKGGVDIESDAVDDIQAFVNTYTKAKHVTIYEPGGLMKTRPKLAPPMPDGLLEMIQYADQQIMQVCGVTPELMGMMQSKEMNSGFLRQQIKQGLTTLATYFDAKYNYLQYQARLYTDCVRILADNSEGRLVKNIIGKSDEKYMPLTKNRIAAQYDIIVDEMPTTPDENMETFQKLMELQGQLMNRPNPVDIMPLVMQFAPLKPDVLDQVMAMMQPPPPPEPDPLNQAILQSEVQYKMSSAEKLSAEAQSISLQTMIKQNELQYAPMKSETDIGLTEAKTMGELAKINKTTQELYTNRMNGMQH